jgi:FlaA1/EpsC-like NDP-sugar epimerase
MGTTKLLGEKLVTAGNKYSGRGDIRLSSVRFGNVLGSSGSVVPLFEGQIRDGGPVTLTDDRMTRFFLTEAEMTELLVSATRLTDGGEVFVRKMTAIGIKDLAEEMIQELAPVYGHDPADIEMERIGRRVGETLHEKIMTKWEAERAIENNDFYAIPPDAEADRYLSYDGIEGFDPAKDLVRTSVDADLLDRDEIIPFLRDADALEATV